MNSILQPDKKLSIMSFNNAQNIHTFTTCKFLFIYLFIYFSINGLKQQGQDLNTKRTGDSLPPY
jgi:hypothetical protein